MKRTIIITALMLAGIFIQPFDPGFLDFIYRFLIFAAASYLVYVSIIEREVPDPEPEPIQSTPSESKADIDVDPGWQATDLLRTDGKSIQYLKDQFYIIANLLFPDAGWIFLKTPAQTIETFHNASLSDKHVELSGTEFPILGLIQILDEGNKILIENNLNREENLLNYYNAVEYRPASFIGIPLSLDDKTKVFYVFDSAAADNFNHEDIAVIEKLTASIQVFINNRLNAYSLFNSLRETRSLLEFSRQLNATKTISKSIAKLSEYISGEFEASRLTVCTMHPEGGRALIRKVIGQTDEFEENSEFSLEEGLTGWIIGRNKPYLIDDLEKGELFIPRYSKEEKTNYGLRSFLGVPIEAEDRVFGAITLEHSVPGKYVIADKEKLIDYVSIFSFVFLRQQS